MAFVKPETSEWETLLCPCFSSELGFSRELLPLWAVDLLRLGSRTPLVRLWKKRERIPEKLDYGAAKRSESKNGYAHLETLAHKPLSEGTRSRCRAWLFCLTLSPLLHRVKADHVWNEKLHTLWSASRLNDIMHHKVQYEGAACPVDHGRGADRAHELWITMEINSQQGDSKLSGNWATTF